MGRVVLHLSLIHIYRLATELAVGAAPDLFPTWGAASTMRKYVEEEAVYNIGEIINANPDRYPILHKIINHPTYKMYNKMYTGDENATYAIYSFSARAYPNFNGVPAYNCLLYTSPAAPAAERAKCLQRPKRPSRNCRCPGGTSR